MIPADPAQCTYSGDPSTSLRDAVRFWSQDTDDQFWLLTDDELDYLIQQSSETTNDHPVWIASRACLVIASKFTREVNVTADAVGVSIGELQSKYLTLAQMLRESWDEEHGDLLVPAPMMWPHHDNSVPPTLFGIGMNDNFEAGLQDYGWRRYPGTPDRVHVDDSLLYGGVEE